MHDILDGHPTAFCGTEYPAREVNEKNLYHKDDNANIIFDLFPFQMSSSTSITHHRITSIYAGSYLHESNVYSWCKSEYLLLFRPSDDISEVVLYSRQKHTTSSLLFDCFVCSAVGSKLSKTLQGS
jgi:hypothetical protein